MRAPYDLAPINLVLVAGGLRPVIICVGGRPGDWGQVRWLVTVTPRAAIAATLLSCSGSRLRPQTHVFTTSQAAPSLQTADTLLSVI